MKKSVKHVKKLIKKAAEAEKSYDAMNFSITALNCASAIASLHLEPLSGKKD